MKILLLILNITLLIYLFTPLHVCAESEPITITILNEGYVTPIEGRNLIPGERNDGARLVASTVGLVIVEDAVIVVDPGMVAEHVNIVALLKNFDLSPESVTHVFISHHHPDHTVSIGMFQNATVVDFWGSYTNDLWEDHGDQYEIAKNVWVMRTPGHTNEDASLVVESENGTYVFTHVWWNEKMEPEIDPLAEDHKSLIESRKKILEVADYIIPGHGRMFANPQK